MLELRPNCECCNRDLPPDSADAVICSYECTFCHRCAEERLFNVCPNCGGNFTPRPIRPSREHRPGISLSHQPASTKRVNTAYHRDELTEFCEPLMKLSPQQR